MKTKRMLSALLAIVMVLMVVPAVYAAEEAAVSWTVYKCSGITPASADAGDTYNGEKRYFVAYGSGGMSFVSSKTCSLSSVTAYGSSRIAEITFTSPVLGEGERVYLSAVGYNRTSFGNNTSGNWQRLVAVSEVSSNYTGEFKYDSDVCYYANEVGEKNANPVKRTSEIDITDFVTEGTTTVYLGCPAAGIYVEDIRVNVKKCLTATYVLNGKEIDTVTKICDGDTATFGAYGYSEDGSCEMYYAPETTLGVSGNIELSKAANSGTYALGGIVAKNGVQYEIKSANLIPNGDFAYGMAGWFDGSGAAADGKFTINGDGTVSSTSNAGNGGAGCLYRSWAIEEGKTYLFTYTDDFASGDPQYRRLSYADTLGDTEETSVIINKSAEDTLNTVFTNTDAHPYVKARFRWNGTTLKFGNFGLYEIEEAQVTVAEEIDTVTMAAASTVVEGNMPILPAETSVTGSLGSLAAGSIVWSNVPESYPVGNTELNGTLTVRFGDAEEITRAVTHTVTVLEESFSLADTQSANGQPGNAVYFPVEITDKFTIEMDVKVNALTDASVQLGYNGSIFGNGALGISTWNGDLNVTGGNAAGTAEKITLTTGIAVGDTLRFLVAMNASDNTYTAAITKADGTILTTGEKTVRRAQSAINSVTFLTNGGGAAGDYDISNIRVSAPSHKKSTYTVVRIVDGAEQSREEIKALNADIAKNEIGDMEGYQKDITVEGTTITAVYTSAKSVTVRFVNAGEEEIYTVTEEVKNGESLTVEAKEVYYLDAEYNGTLYAIPETVTDENKTVTVYASTTKFPVTEDAYVDKDNKIHGIKATNNDSVFVANDGPTVDANGEKIYGAHTPSTLGSARAGFFMFPVVDAGENVKAVARLKVRAFHDNGFSNGNDKLRFMAKIVTDESWASMEEGGSYAKDEAPVFADWTEYIFSDWCTKASTEIVFDLTEVMVKAKAAGLKTITVKMAAGYGAAYIAEREACAAGGMYEGMVSYIEVVGTESFAVTAEGLASLTKNGSVMNGIAYVEKGDDVRLVSEGALVVSSDNGYYMANENLNLTRGTAMGETIPAKLGLAMLNGAQVRIGAARLEEGDKLAAHSDSGIRFIATADYTGTVIEDETVEFGIKAGVEASDKVIEIKAVNFQNEEKTVFTAAITGLAESNFNRMYTACAYAKVPMADGTIREFTTESVTRSIYQVSAGLMKGDAASESTGTNTVEGVVKNVLNAYINQTGIRIKKIGTEWAADDVYTGYVFFTVESVDNGDGTVTVTVAPDATWGTPVEIAAWWKDYVRVNNNNSTARMHIFNESFADGVLTFDIVPPANE